MPRFLIRDFGASLEIEPHEGSRLRIAVFSDVHSPYHDPHALELALMVASWFKPDIVILNGDFVDFHAISRFSTRPIRRMLFAREVEFAIELLRHIRQALGKATFIYLEGNHEFRLKSYLWNKAKELSELPDLSVERLLKLDELGIRYAQRAEDPRPVGEFVAAQVKVSHLYITHGDTIRVSGNTLNVARTVFLKVLVPILLGHWHRVQHYEQTDYAGNAYGCWVVGCLCLPPLVVHEGTTPRRLRFRIASGTATVIVTYIEQT